MTQTLTCRRNTVGFAFASLNFESNWRMVIDSVATYESNGILKMTGLANCKFLIAVQSDAWLTTALGACKYMQQYVEIMIRTVRSLMCTWLQCANNEILFYLLIAHNLFLIIHGWWWCGHCNNATNKPMKSLTTQRDAVVYNAYEPKQDHHCEITIEI